MSTTTVPIYCVKCRGKKDTEATRGPISWKDANGKDRSREGYHGKCPTCGTNIKQFAKKLEVAAQPAPTNPTPNPVQQVPPSA